MIALMATVEWLFICVAETTTLLILFWNFSLKLCILLACHSIYVETEVPRIHELPITWLIRVGHVVDHLSVHNQCIEHLWRDLFTGCTTVFYNLFYFMEDNGILQPDNPVELFCLHYVFVPQTNISLNQFVSMWNYHLLQSMSNKSSYQLWTTGRHSETCKCYKLVHTLIISCW